MSFSEIHAAVSLAEKQRQRGCWSRPGLWNVRYFVPLRHCTDMYKCVQCTSVYWVLNAPCANAVAQHSAAVAARPYLSSKPRRRRSSPTAQHLQLLQPCLVGFLDRLVLQHSSFVMFNNWAVMLHGASPVQDGLAGHSRNKLSIMSNVSKPSSRTYAETCCKGILSWKQPDEVGESHSKLQGHARANSS